MAVCNNGKTGLAASNRRKFRREVDRIDEFIMVPLSWASSRQEQKPQTMLAKTAVF
jgi:hypothetical protein